jgi:hypothetical protein
MKPVHIALIVLVILIALFLMRRGAPAPQKVAECPKCKNGYTGECQCNPAK